MLATVWFAISVAIDDSPKAQILSVGSSKVNVCSIQARRSDRPVPLGWRH
jgi:hypothetical protein